MPGGCFAFFKCCCSICLRLTEPASWKSAPDNLELLLTLKFLLKTFMFNDLLIYSASAILPFEQLYGAKSTANVMLSVARTGRQTLNTQTPSTTAENPNNTAT